MGLVKKRGEQRPKGYRGVASRIERGKRKAWRIFSAGIGASVIAPPIGGVIAALGLPTALRARATKKALERRLMHRPKIARRLAERYRGTEHGAFFERIANKAEKRAGRRRKAA